MLSARTSKIGVKMGKSLPCVDVSVSAMSAVERLKSRVAELESENRVLSAAVAVHNQMRLKIRDWWTFGKGQFAQEHTHSWHTREDFIAMWDRELSKATSTASKTP